MCKINKIKKIKLLIVITVLLLFEIILGNKNYVFASNNIDNIETKHLIQSTNDESLWNGYISLGIEKLYANEKEPLDVVTDKVKRSCVKLECYKNKEETEVIASGSGFIYKITKNKIYIVTAEHVADSAPYGKLKVYYLPEDFQQVTFSMYGLENVGNEQIQKEIHTAQVMYLSKKCDLAILEVDISNLDYNCRYDFKSISSFEKSELKLNENLYFYVANRYGEKTQLKTVKTIASNEELNSFGGSYVWTTNAAINGDSGSLLFNKNGEIVSILQAIAYVESGHYLASVDSKTMIEECEKFFEK